MVKQDPTDAQQKQNRRALLSYALFRWESAAILALTLILVVLVPDPFRGVLPAWRWWFWLVLGFLAEVGIVLTTLQDPDVRARLANERVRNQLAPTSIANVDHRQIAERALHHRAEIELMFQRTRRQAQREQLRLILDGVTRWTAGIVQLAQYLDDDSSNHVSAQKETVLQDSLHALETTYARLQLVAAQGFNERRIDQLRDEIDKQVRVLYETMETLS